jgi:hypothetical protein
MMGKDSSSNIHADDDDYYYYYVVDEDDDDYYASHHDDDPVEGSIYVVGQDDDNYYGTVGTYNDDDDLYATPVETGNIYGTEQDDYYVAAGKGRGAKGKGMKRGKGQGDDYVVYTNDDYDVAPGKGRDRSKGMMKMSSDSYSYYAKGYYPASQSPAPIAYANYTPSGEYSMSGKGKRSMSKMKSRSSGSDSLPDTEAYIYTTYSDDYPNPTMYTYPESGNVFEKSSGMMSMREKGRHRQPVLVQSTEEMTVMAQDAQPEQPKQREKERHRERRGPPPEPEQREKERHPQRRHYRPPPVQSIPQQEMTVMAQQETTTTATREGEKERHPRKERRHHEPKQQHYSADEATMSQQEISTTREREKERHPRRERRYHEPKQHSAETTMPQQELQPPDVSTLQTESDKNQKRYVARCQAKCSLVVLFAFPFFSAEKYMHCFLWALCESYGLLFPILQCR